MIKKLLQFISDPFWETANLVALTMLAVASLLTLDPWLIAGGLLVETGYLFWASKSLRYAQRVQARKILNPKGVESLDRCLLIVTVAGMVVILFFGFGKHLLSHPFPYLTHAGGWEAGAIAWTVLFLFYYLLKFRLVKGPKGEILPTLLSVLIGFVCFPLLIYFACISLGDARPIKHVVCVFSLGLCFLCLDLLAAKYHEKAKEKALSRASLRWADWPMVVAFGVLLAYLWHHSDAEHQEVFVSGVISCQLVISNVVFVVMEFGFLRPPLDRRKAVTYISRFATRRQFRRPPSSNRPATESRD